MILDSVFFCHLIIFGILSVIFKIFIDLYTLDVTRSTSMLVRQLEAVPRMKEGLDNAVTLEDT